ncbi:hypothetical protein OWO78_01200 [Bacillus pacificus]|uniref:Uncharacterized protein n=1 Tax=Bacillus pacificus TaxID=2026187 RepID=A0AAW6YPP7_9BACI|nr:MULTISPECIES: hypothetical protein [Bacillus cereus group]ONG81217.1 hypothetical protein BKK41_12000 [Bacillus cereus]MDK7385480.1 hypothetical protein [Bacillus pacificus]MDK7390051.1 hypothetical protein [Bacillus pacificus]MDK7397077.1 hypothetical protein [Bacillus pacificus]MDK7401621.1 hypothetical protein [Bacillus pacificus]
MSKVGRRKKEYPENKIKEIILRFVEEKGVRAEIPKRTLSEYAKNLFREGNIPWLDEEISDNYWIRSERRGFQLIEEYNAIVPKTLAQNNYNTVQLPKIDEIILKHCKDPKQLQRKLFPYEKELTLSQNKNNELQDELNQLKERLNEQNICIADLEKKVKLQQEIIFMLFNHGAVSNPKIRNLMEMGEEMDSIVKDAFQNIFNLKADQFLSVSLENTHNIVSINEQKSKRSLLDDFKKL